MLKRLIPAIALILEGLLGLSCGDNDVSTNGDSNGELNAAFSWTALGREVEFVEQSTCSNGPIEAWHWRFGDGHESSDQHPVYRYDAEGSYVAFLNVTTRDERSDSCSDTIHVTNEPPNVSFSYVINGWEVTFADQTTDDGLIESWYWVFGDVSSSELQNPMHAYGGPGAFEVVLTATDNDGNIASHNDTVEIASQAPVAGFSYSVDGRTVGFTDKSTDPDGVVVSWYWDFGDGEESSLQSPVHTYSEIQSYEVTLTVTDDYGNTGSAIDTVTTENYVPEASFTYDVVDSIVQLTDVSSDADGSITSWNWDFGDGDSSTEQNPSHTYEVAGDYQVSLVVHDDLGAADTAAQTVSLFFDYVVYRDKGLVPGSDVWTWDGSDWGLAPGQFNGSYHDPTAPEGDTCFMAKSGSGGSNYAGWGVFLVNPDDHTVDLAAYTHLRFWAKSPSNLKIEIQHNGRYGSKSTVWMDQYGWDGTDTWQEVSVPFSAFTSGSHKKIFGLFMVTVVRGDRTFFIDHVRWVRE